MKRKRRFAAKDSLPEQYRTDFAIWLLSALCGAAVGLGVTLFVLVINGLESFTAITGASAAAPGEISFAHSYKPLAGGFLLVGYYLLAQRLGWLVDGGVGTLPDTLRARMTGEAAPPLSKVIATSGASALSLSVGASMGRESPAAYLGASCCGLLAQRLRLSPERRRILLGCGAGAAVATCFNTPIGGALFALEVVMGAYALSYFVPIAFACVSATLVSTQILGDHPTFHLSGFSESGAMEVFLCAPLGLFCGVVSGLFLSLVKTTINGFAGFRKRFGITRLYGPLAGGLLLGAIGLYFPQALGTGYDVVYGLSSYPVLFLLALLLAKMLACAISVASGFSGGFIGASMVIGAFVGALFAAGAQALHLSEAHAYFVFVGLGALSAAAVKAPISTTLMVLEMTGQHEIALPLIVAAGPATMISHRIGGRSFFVWQLARKGFDLFHGEYALALRHIRALNIMTKETNQTCLDVGEPCLLAGQNLLKLLAAFKESGRDTLPVISSPTDRRIIGWVSHKNALVCYNDFLINHQKTTAL